MSKEYHNRAGATLSYVDLSETFEHAEIENKCLVAMSGYIKCKDNTELSQNVMGIMDLMLMFHRK